MAGQEPIEVQGGAAAVIQVGRDSAVITTGLAAPAVVNSGARAAVVEMLRGNVPAVASPAPVSATPDYIKAAIGNPTTEPSGFPNRTDSVIAFDELTRTFSIAPVGVSFDVWLAGDKLTVTESKSIVLPDSSGSSFIYFDADSGELQRSSSFDASIIMRHAYCAAIYWNSAHGKAVYFGEERHGVTMDGATHAHLHLSLGTQWINGLALTGIQSDATGDLDAHAQLGYQAGLIRDEDIELNLASQAAPAEVPVYYRQGTDWYASSVDAFPLIYAGKDGWAGTLPAAAIDSGGSWSLAEVANNGYLLVHMLATNDVRYPVVAVLGKQYPTKSQAREAALTEFDEFTGLPFQEFTPIGTVIYQCQDGDANTPSAHVVSTADGGDYIDWRSHRSFAGAAAASGDQEIFIGEQPAISYPALALLPVDGEPGLYDLTVNA